MSLNTTIDKQMLTMELTYGITLNPQYQAYELPADQQFPVAYSYFIKKLQNLQSVLPYVELYPEMSPCHETRYYKSELQKPRLHFHGLAKVNGKEYYFNGGFIKIAENNHCFIQKNAKEEYYLKNAQTMASICQHFQLPYPYKWGDGNPDIIEQWYQRSDNPIDMFQTDHPIPLSSHPRQ